MTNALGFPPQIGKQRNHGHCMKKADREKQHDKFGFCLCTCVFVCNPINHVEENSLVHPVSKNTVMNCKVKSFPFTRKINRFVYIFEFALDIAFQGHNSTGERS
jgi:hypothetical protein